MAYGCAQVAFHFKTSSVAGVLDERGWVDVHAIGASAVNQTVKAIACRLVEKSGDGPIKVI